MNLKKLATYIAVALVVCVVVVAIFAPSIAPEDPNRIKIGQRLDRPGDRSLLGRDYLGRDLWSRLVYGARISLLVGASAASLASIGGTLVGLLGGFSRGFLGSFLMRFVDTVMSFPATMLALALVAVLGQRLSNIIIALSIAYLPRIARVVHASTLQIREMDYVASAVAVGAGTLRVLIRHILPNALGPLFVQASFIFAYAVIAESGLSFIGVGVPAGTPSWGNILADGRAYLLSAPWLMISAGFAIFILVLSLNTIGDALRDRLDPRLRGPGNI